MEFYKVWHKKRNMGVICARNSYEVVGFFNGNEP